MAVEGPDIHTVAPSWQAVGGKLRASRPDVSVRPHDSEGITSDGSEAELAPANGHEDYRRRYHPESAIGRGGMGVVWLARQESLHRAVALKVAHERLADTQRTQFQVEAACTAWLEHPNIVPIYDAGHDFIVMKRIEGDTLERLLTSERLRTPEVIDILIKVCDALSFAHSRGIMHRDVKPENIMVGRFGEVVLMDWGLALQIELPADGHSRAPLKGSRRNLCAGTPGYMAPEMARAEGDLIGYATDVFLLGATLYRCLSGHLPFDGEDAFEALTLSAANDWQPVLQFAEHAPPRLVSLQERTMAERPSDRPSIADVQGVLRDWLMSANAEAEAGRCHERGVDLLGVARSAGRSSDEAYSAYSEALHYFDRAITLCPEHMEYESARSEVVREFAWAAASAGEPGLARLLRRSGRLPSPTGTGQFHAGGVTADSLVAGLDENRRLVNSLGESRRHLEVMGNRVAELEAALARRAQQVQSGYVAVIALMIALVSVVVVLAVR